MNAAELHRQSQDAVNTADIDAFVRLYDAEARVLLPDGAILGGRGGGRGGGGDHR